MDPATRDAVTEWAVSNSLGVGLSSINAMRAVGEIREFLLQRRTLTGLFAEEPIVDERQWLQFYNSPKALERQLIRGLFDEQAGECTAVMDALRNPRRADEASKLAAFSLILASLSKANRDDWSHLLAILLEDDEPEDADAAEIDESFFTAIGFYFWVYLPCWLVYGMSPTDLMRKLSAGDKVAEQAAERLIRLDHRVAAHPKLRRWINADPRVARFRQQKTQKWKTRTPFDKEKSASLALRVIAAYVSRTSELLDERIESTELRSLIEALGKQVPDDLQAYHANRTTDDWSREIRRYREHLVKLRGPDKSAIESVRAVLGSLE